jgi:UDP-glucose 4-epimerase
VKALITGGAGFIGSHLADTLLARGYEVIILDNLSTGRHSNIHCMARADVAFHLAAAVGVELIVDHPLESLATNIRGSEIVMEKAHKHGTKILVTSTSEIYGKNTSDRLGEEDDRILGSPLKSRWSYSEAKAIEEILAYTYYRQKGLPSVIVRLFNTVGPRQTGHYGMVIPRFVGQAVKGEAVTVYGTGAQTRCFCYVGDVVDALVKLSEHPEAVGRVFNLGGSQEISIDALAHRVIELAGSDSKVRYVSYEEAYEEGFEDMQRRVPDTTRARELIGFEPTVDLDGILRSVIADQRG